MRSGERRHAPAAKGGANSAAYEVWNGRTRPSPSVSWLVGGFALSCLPAALESYQSDLSNMRGA